MKVFSTRSDELLSQIMRIIVYSFKIIGLAPLSLQQMKKSVKNSRSNYCISVFRFSKIGLTYNIVLAILSVIMGCLAIPEISRTSYPNITALSRAVDIAQAILRTSTICVIIIRWSLRQKRAASIMNRLLEVDCLLSGLEICVPNTKTSFLSPMIQIITEALLWVTFSASQTSYVHSFLLFFIFDVPIFLIHWFVVEYSIVVQILTRKLESLNHNLLHFNEFHDFPFYPATFSNEFLAASQPSLNHTKLSVLKLLHSIRSTLSEVSQDIASFFSFPILPVIACLSLAIVYNTNYLITPIIVKTDDIPIATYIHVATWVAISVYPLVLLSFNVTKTLKEGKKTGPLVHRLLCVTTRREIQTELERFSLELLHEDIKFTAYGFFSLDFTLIQSVTIIFLCLSCHKYVFRIFWATVTYLVIIIQFMQSAANASKNT